MILYYIFCIDIFNYEKTCFCERCFLALSYLKDQYAIGTLTAKIITPKPI